MNINELLDLMEETLDESMALPLANGKRMVDVDRVKDIIDDIRSTLPHEIEQARSITTDRTQILESAHREAEKTIKAAEEKARRMVEEQEIVRAAKRRADKIENEANARAKAVLVGVFGKCDSVMGDTEERLLKYAADIKLLRAALHRNPVSSNKEES